MIDVWTMTEGQRRTDLTVAEGHPGSADRWFRSVHSTELLSTIRLTTPLNRFGGSSGPEIRAQVAIALWAKTRALLIQKVRFAAMVSFRTMYAALVPDQQELVRLLLACVPDLIAIGTSAREMLEILSSDRKKADTVIPLVVALRQRAGESVHAPAEELEVAADIGKQIDAKMGTVDAGDPAAPST